MPHLLVLRLFKGINTLLLLVVGDDRVALIARPNLLLRLYLRDRASHLLTLDAG